ncbi:MAG TPA: hypothetical protein VKT53_16265 [Candidatus Acidoferrum sp.]|nr:hypothetical protein [Candidatus Acidoferrum sp.]
MSHELQHALEKLRAELAFIEKGGYRNPTHLQWRPQFIFEDSAICLNRDPTQKHIPCSECVLMRFVPSSAAQNRAPCRHIPLNDNGETVDFFYRTGTQDELETAVTAWIRKTIATLEQELAKVESIQALTEIHVKAKARPTE